MSAEGMSIPGAIAGAQVGRPYSDRIEARVSDPNRDAAVLRARVDAVSRGAVRASVLGINDGLVTNICLILAVAGADSGTSAIRVAGFASLIAGAFSMAAGEWISVRSQVELYRGLLAEIRDLTRRNPRLIMGELTDHLVEAGFASDTAQRAAAELPLDEHKFFDFTARTVFGVDQGALGSPWTAALSSLALFSFGALVPLLPWFFLDESAAIATAVALTAIVAMVVGGWVGRSAGRPIAVGAVRQLLIVVAASAVTYGIGALFGTAIA